MFIYNAINIIKYISYVSVLGSCIDDRSAVVNMVQDATDIILFNIEHEYITEA
jgi:hypothetical protein